MWCMVFFDLKEYDLYSCLDYLWVKHLWMNLNGLNRCLRSLVQACMIFYAKIAIVHFPLILFGSLADNFWNLSHVCLCNTITPLITIWTFIKVIPPFFAITLMLYLTLYLFRNFGCMSLDIFLDYLFTLQLCMIFAWFTPI